MGSRITNISMLLRRASVKKTATQVEDLSKDTKGFSLVELLCAGLITVLVAGMLVTVVGLMANSVKNIQAHSNAKVLCSTLTIAVQDELRYASNITYDSASQTLWFRSGSIGFSDHCRLAAVDGNDCYTESSGYLALYAGNADTYVARGEEKKDGKDYQRKLVEKATYTNGLSAKVVTVWDAEKSVITATIAVYDKEGNLCDQRTIYTMKNARDIRTGTA